MESKLRERRCLEPGELVMTRRGLAFPRTFTCDLMGSPGRFTVKMATKTKYIFLIIDHNIAGR